MFDLSQVYPLTKKRLEKNELLVSRNIKTGLSINSRILPAKVADKGVHRAIPATCKPTEWCKEHCYARYGHFVTWGRLQTSQLNKVQQAYLVNAVILHRFESAREDVVAQEADRIVRVATRKGFNNIRWNGGGDLSKGAVRLINLITERHPKFLVWGFSKRADLALKLEPRNNLRLTMSLDPSTPPWGKSGCSFEELVRAASLLGGRLAFATHIPGDSRIQEIEARLRDSFVKRGVVRLDTVFGFHRSTKHTTVGDRKECPATNPEVDGAGCQSCRWCFMSLHERKTRRIKSPYEAYMTAV